MPGGADVSARQNQSECPAGPICLRHPSACSYTCARLFGVAGVFVLPSFRFQYFLAVCDLFLISFSCPGRCCPLELLFPPVTVFCLLASGDLLVLHVPVPPDVFARRSCFLGTSCTDHVLFAPPSAVFAPCCARRLFGGTRQTAPYRPYLRHSALLRDR